MVQHVPLLRGDQLIIYVEFGNTSDVERSLTVSDGDQRAEEWLDLQNGCICCSVKDSGVNAIESLMERRGEAFDYILLETTGLADPGNIAPVFWVDDGLGSTIYLDGIVTLVDAANLLRSLDQPIGDEVVTDEDGIQHNSNADPQDRSPQGGKATDNKHQHSSPHFSIAHLQISHADVIVVNKVDLVSTAQLEAVVTRVRSINSVAKMHFTDHSVVPVLDGLVLDLRAYNDVTAGDLQFASKGHSHLDPAIGTISLHLPVCGAAVYKQLDRWLQQVLWNKSIPGFDDLTDWAIHRTKGRVVMTDGSVFTIQGVREIYEIVESRGQNDSTSQEQQASKIVFIGRGMNDKKTSIALQESLNHALRVS